MENKLGILISTASQIAVRLIGLIIALFSLKLLTNYLGKEGTGEYNTIITYLNFAIVIADLGLFSSSVREIAKDRSRERQILSNVLTIRAITALIAALVATEVIFISQASHLLKMGVAVASGYIFFNLLASTYDILLQERLQMQYSALAELLSKMVAIIALFIIIKLDGGFLWAVATVTLSGLIILLGKMLFSRHLGNISFAYDQKLSHWILATSLPLGIVFIVNNLYFKVDTLLLYAIKGAGAVGIYSVAYKVLEVTIFIASYFASSLKPTLSRRIVSDPHSVGNTVSTSLLIMFFISLPITVLASFFATPIILFLSTPAFLEGSRALILLSWTLPVIYADILLGEVLVAKDARQLLLAISAIMLTVNLLLNIYFIPRYSYMGAAFTTLLSECVLLIINMYMVRQFIPLRFAAVAYLKLATCVAGMAIAAWIVRALPLNFLFEMLLVGSVYISLAYILNLFRPQDLRQIIKSGT